MPGFQDFISWYQPVKNGKSFTHAGNLKHTGKKWTFNAAYKSVGANYNAEVGYVPRVNYIKLNPQASYNFFPKGGSILTHGPQFNSTYFFDKKMDQTDHENNFTYLITFRNKATLSAIMMDDYVKVLFPFDPTNSGKDSLLYNSKYSWRTVGADFDSKPQSLFNYSFSFRYGVYYANGKKYTVSSELGYRFQPILNLSLAASYNQLQLPAPWGNTGFWHVGPKVDITFTAKLFFTTYVQYNQQIDNTNINARFQ
jgi:hypothetical protein